MAFNFLTTTFCGVKLSKENEFYFCLSLIKLALHVAHNAKGQGLILDNVSAGYHTKIIVDGVSFSVPTEK
ncbi:Ferric enterobactin transport ATP-binding protein fepC [Escherichia coli]|uniref:Ferric enterobactin transport ATP-binding protein fepC n=1 Tax=Escherichia coli TaxID=562 RepID=A0A376MIL5_ECOLX|nr:Ferric enterobactin transport ATP-binding protein fepC [Escherichia coli]